MFFVGRILGLSTSRKIFAFLFSTVGPIFKSKKIIKNNLSIYSNKISYLEEKKIIDNMWKNYGMTFMCQVLILGKNKSYHYLI